MHDTSNLYAGEKSDSREKITGQDLYRLTARISLALCYVPFITIMLNTRSNNRSQAGQKKKKMCDQRVRMHQNMGSFVDLYTNRENSSDNFLNDEPSTICNLYVSA
jgi:hypothetical protein